LERRTDRKREITKFLRRLQPGDVTFIKAIDGKALKSKAGRSELVSKNEVRLSWNADNGRDRESHVIRVGKSFKAGKTEIWGMAACAMSHAVALTEAMSRYADYDAVLIIEDDVKFADGVTTQKAKNIIQLAVDKIASVNSVNWKTLQLGCESVGPCKSKRRKIAHLMEGTCLHVAERSYQTHAYVVNQVSAALLLQHLRAGKTASGAITALQGFAARSNKRGCYMLKPNLLEQQQNDSETCTATTWPEAHKNNYKSKSMNKLSSSSKKIPMRCLKGLRKRVGAAGGKVCAGRNASAADVKKKSDRLLRAFQKSGKWPTRALAKEKWNVSTPLWERLRKEHCAP
jgi:GR25 family glycosyltransferase involved in LPS biosynthesis